MRLKTTTTALLAAAAAGLATAPAEAKTHVAVGMGDQNPAMFSDANFRSLGIKKVRYFIRWNAIKNPGELAAADAFVNAARANKKTVLMHISTDDFTEKKAKLPSVKLYKRDVGRLVRRYKAKGVKEWGVWNEANHKTQPTWDNPKRAAQYFRTMRSLCKGCKIVALDILDQKGSEKYIARWFAALPRSYRSLKSLIVGIHNYSDTNRKRSSGTSKIIRTTKARNRRTSFWLTETGALVSFGKSFPCSESRQKNRISYMFTLAKKYRRDIDRIYSYNWFGTDCTNRFDAGLVKLDGSPRPAYATFKSRAKSFTR